MPPKDPDNLSNFISKHFQVFLQKISLSLHLFFRNELFNHAGAAAFFSSCQFHLNESRTATAITETASVLFVMMPDVFEELLQANTVFARDVIQVLCNRLRKTHFDERP